MPTLNQLSRFPRSRGQSLACKSRKPQRKGVVVRVLIRKPKKPNSAQRKVAKVRIIGEGLVDAYIMGENHSLQEHAVVLVRRGRVRDLPGVHNKLIRGKFDFLPVLGRMTSRSKYGLKSPSP